MESRRGAIDSRRSILLALLSAPALWLAGCTVSTRIRMPAPRAGQGPDDVLQVSLTHAVLDPKLRGPFDAQVRSLLAAMPDQPGLVLFSARREWFGDQVWTMTAWESEAARSRFFASPRHSEAMRVGGPAIVHVRTKRVELRRGELPLTWPQALALLGDAGWTRSSGSELQR